MSILDRLIDRRIHLEGRLRSTKAEIEILQVRLDEVSSAIMVVESCSLPMSVDGAETEPAPSMVETAERERRRDVRGEIRAYFAEHRDGVTGEELQNALDITSRSVDLALSYLSKKNEIEVGHGRWYPWGSLKSAGAAEPEAEPAPVSHDGNGHADSAPVEQPVAPADIDRLLDVLAEAPGIGLSLLRLEDEGISPAIVKAAFQARRISRKDINGETVYEIAA